LDAVIQDQVPQLFSLNDKQTPRIDKLSRDIIQTMTEKGKQTIYSLYKEIPHVSQSKIRRRFQGSTTYVGLEKEIFITPFVNIPFRETEPKYSKYFYLEFKGFLVSLSFTQLEDHPLFKTAVDVVETYLSSHIVPVFIDYVKAELASWFQAHIENGLQLDYIKVPHLYYYHTKHAEKTFGELYNVVQPIVPDFILDPKASQPILVNDWEHSYSVKFQELIDRRVELGSKLSSAIEGFDEPLRNAVWRWNEIMWVIYWWRRFDY